MSNIRKRTISIVFISWLIIAFIIIFFANSIKMAMISVNRATQGSSVEIVVEGSGSRNTVPMSAWDEVGLDETVGSDPGLKPGIAKENLVISEFSSDDGISDPVLIALITTIGTIINTWLLTLRRKNS